MNTKRAISYREGDNQRKARWKQLHYPASIAFDDGSPLQRCSIADISVIGATLAIESGAAIPKEFTLVLAGETGPRRRCRLVWRTDLEIGVQFIKSPEDKRERGSKAISGRALLDC